MRERGRAAVLTLLARERSSEREQERESEREREKDQDRVREQEREIYRESNRRHIINHSIEITFVPVMSQLTRHMLQNQATNRRQARGRPVTYYWVDDIKKALQ